MSNKKKLFHISRTPQLSPIKTLNSHTIVFTHIPKAAGLTLDIIFRAISVAENSKYHRIMGTIYSQFLGEGKQDISDIISVSEALADEFTGARFIVGHVPYGFSDHLPQPHVYLTILREPIQRMLSQYNFGNEKGGWPESHDPKLLIEQGLMVDNPQVRQIAGCTDKREPCDEAMLEQAIKNLDNKYQFVGVAERFNDLLESLITAFQWPDVIYGYFNEGKRKESPPSQNFIDTLREFNEFDVKLYAHAVARKSPIADNIISIDLKTHVKAVGLQTKVVVVAPMKIRGEYYPLVDRAEIKTLKSELESLGFTIHRFSNTDSNGAKGMESTPSH